MVPRFPYVGRALLLLLFLVLPLGFASWAAMAADVFVGTPPFNPDTGQQVSIDLSVDVFSDVLGSYFVDLLYDPAVVTVVSISGGATAEFSGSPTTDPNSFGSGTTPIAAVQGSTTSPTGFVSVATITFQAVGLPADGSNLDLTVDSLYDGSLNPLSSVVFPSSVLINVPEVATDLEFVDGETMTWTAAPNISIYNLYRGGHPEIPLSFGHSCLEAGIAATTATDTGTPVVNEGFYYLLSGERNLVEGHLGLTAAGLLRPNSSPCSLAPAAGSPAGPAFRIEGPGGRSASMRSRVMVAAPGSRLPDGDIDHDGALDPRDVQRLLDALVGARPLDPGAASMADIEADGDVDVADAQLLQQILEGGTEIPPGSLATEHPVLIQRRAVQCAPLDLTTGLNTALFPCVPEGYSSFDLLMALGAANVTSIHVLDPSGGGFLMASFLRGAPSGSDFPIHPGKAYAIQMRRAHSRFTLLD